MTHYITGTRRGHALAVWGASLIVLHVAHAWGGFGDEHRRFIPSDAVSSQDFGDALDISGNLLVVGAEDTPSGLLPSVGIVYAFDAQTGQQLFSLSPNDPPASRAFGSAVATDGQHIVVAAEDDSNVTGVAYLFNTQGTQLHRLAASDGAPNHEFGQAIGIDQGIAVVGAPGVHSFRGQIYLFDTATGAELRSLSPEDLMPGDEFGNSVGISQNRIIVGMENGGLGGPVYLFDTDGDQLHRWEPPVDPISQEPVRGFGRNVAISGNLALVGATPADDQVAPNEIGRAYIFDVQSGQQLWELRPDDSQGQDLFGEGVDIDGSLALVVARHEAALGTLNTAYLFDAFTGQQVGRLNPLPDIIPQDEALERVALSGRFAAGGVESFDSPGFSNNGMAIVFDVQRTQAGDYNGDLAVDAADAGIMFADWGAASSIADENVDGIVDAADAGILFAAWTGDVPSATSVPEPLFIPGLLAWLFIPSSARRSWRHKGLDLT